MKSNRKRKNGKKVVLSTVMTIFTLLSCGMATFAWFTVTRPKADIGTISGNLDFISIDRVSAYRYVYPFYQGSNIFIDYDKNPDGSDKGKLKEFVLQDKNENAYSSAYHVDYGSTAPYCIIGDSVFNGRKGKDFSTDEGWPLYQDSSSSSLTYSAKDVVLSKGASFVVAKKDSSVISSFETTSEGCLSRKNGVIFCQKAGLYNFTVSDEKLTIEESLSRRDKDSAIIGRTRFDPTYAKINNVDGAKAIYSQNTCIIFDIGLTIRKQDNPIDFSLTINRFDLDNANHPSRVDPKTKEVGKESSYLYASDFRDYRIHDVSSSEVTSSSAWDSFHQEKDYYSETEQGIVPSLDGRFVFDDKKQSNLKIIPDTAVDNYETNTKKRILIAIDFNPERVEYFFESNRLGREYSLLRDYTFYFNCRQHLAEEGEKTE